MILDAFTRLAWVEEGLEDDADDEAECLEPEAEDSYGRERNALTRVHAAQIQSNVRELDTKEQRKP